MHRPAAAIACIAAALAAQDPMQKPPPELGTVAWQRDLDAALGAKGTKPLFVLFQEIPGCSTCTGFGKDVLSHPLLAAAIETAFVPVAVRNNADGAEKAVCERFREPSWNNPVVRFLDRKGKDLLPRQDGVFDAHGIAVRMARALEAAKTPVPGFLAIARDESDPATKTTMLTMHCFWEGEAVLGALDGVVRTRSVFVGGAEGVEVTFLPARLSPEALVAAAQTKSCKPVDAKTPVTDAPASDQQHALGGTPFAERDLSPMQRTKVHAAITLGEDPLRWLTPAQAARAALPRK